MKYFFIQDWKTWEPWDRIQAERARYKDYIGTIRHRLPADLQRLCDFSPGWSEKRISLNDSQLSQISASCAAQTMTLVLNGHYSSAEAQRIGLRRFTLNYKGVTLFQINEGAETASNPGPDADLPEDEAPGGGLYGIAFDDHGWDEIELLEDGLFEHRMLFASGTETVIRFRDFTLDYTDTPHAEATE